MEWVTRRDAIRALTHHLVFYCSTFVENDWKARKVNSFVDYLDVMEKDVVDVEGVARSMVEHAAREADERLRRIHSIVNGKQAARLKWRWIIVKGRYEEGHPHTIDDPDKKGGYVVLSMEMIAPKTAKEYRHLVSTLIHEKVHLYQRRYPGKMNACLHRWFQPVGIRQGRANPDIDRTLWQDRVTGKRYDMRWRGTPRSMVDLDGKAEHEHPYEEMAYAIERKAMR